MNTKVVTVWTVVIILLFGIGIFGAANQDLLVKVEDKNDPFQPSLTPKDNEEIKKCTYGDPAKGLSYQFRLEAGTNTINAITISYQTNYPNPEAYEAAKNICGNEGTGACDKKLTGVGATFTGNEEEFRILLNVSVNDLNAANLQTHVADLAKLNIVLDSITDYQAYVTAINNNIASTENASYKCE